jgi:hypothetical protein
MRDPASAFYEDGARLNLLPTRDYLEAIDRTRNGTAEPDDAMKLDELVAFISSLKGRKLSITQPKTGQQLSIHS